MMMFRLPILMLMLFVPSSLSAAVLIDDVGRQHDFKTPPSKVISLIPSATEIICALGAESALAAVTYHDERLAGIAGLPIVGGAFTPQFALINALEPDLLLVAPRDYEKALIGRGDEKYPILVWDDGVGLADSEFRIRRLGEIFNKRPEAEKIIADNQGLRKLVADKLGAVPPEKRQRTMRLLYSGGKLLTPGSGHFQNELIAAAGGLPPEFGPGAFVEVSPEKWRAFAPEFIFDCGLDHKALREFLSAEDWAGVPAVEKDRFYNFPCALTCRAAANVGYFTAWLSSVLYAEEFSDPEKLVRPQELISERRIEVDLPYVAQARIVDSRLMDFIHRALVIDFKRPQMIISTDGGQREGILTIGNSYSPAPAWGIYHKLGYEESNKLLFKVLEIESEKSEFMSTGADLNNLVVKSASFKDMTVTALATAGVEGNALRASRDIGAWYEPGTINIIVMTNHRLSPRAAARAMLTVTEAKTAALWDMDIRSVQSPKLNPATGTGTDSLIIVAGEGIELNWSGGHAKLGELMAEAVYGAVQEAILKQNGKPYKRHVFARLAERGLTPSTLTGGPDCPCLENARDFQADLEALLLEPRYQGFIEAAFSLSDARVMGQVGDLSSFEAWALSIASEIAGQPVESLENIVADDLPEVLNRAVNALGAGLKYKDYDRGGQEIFAPCGQPSRLDKAAAVQ